MTNERQDDEIIGRALSRAIETIDVNQTPYERSRLATAPARRSILGLWQIATAAAAIVLALAIGSWLTRPTESQPGVAASPTAPAATPSAAAPTPAATSTPTVTPAATAVDHAKIYLGRANLPPVAVSGPQFADTVVTANQRIASRITGLRAYRQSAAPAGLTNYLWNNSFQGGVAVAITADLAKVDIQLEQPFSASDHAAAFAILQQLVYTATEEPGIRRVLLTANGGQKLTIGDIGVDKPLAREDVFGYSYRAAVGKDQRISWPGNDAIQHIGAALLSTSIDGTTARLTFRGQNAAGGGVDDLPSVAIWLEQSDDTNISGAKYALNVVYQWNGGFSSGGVGHTKFYDQTPLRSISGDFNTSYRIELDDARPWRAYMPDKTQLVVEIGGDPRATSDRIAVTAPKPGDIANSGADLRLTGSARVFEATVSWRLLDAASKEVTSGHFNANLGSSALWGTFDTRIPLPANVRGNLTLELFESSPKDGSAQGIVQIPLVVR